MRRSHAVAGNGAGLDRASKWYQLLCSSTALDAQTNSVAAVVERKGVPPDFVRYWNRKLVDPTFHSGSIGGTRNNKFSADGQLFVETLLYREIELNPFRSTSQLARDLKKSGVDVDRK